MALLSDFCGETANSPGTSATVNLGGPINGSFRTFAQCYSTGQKSFYFMTDDVALRECGTGTFTAGSPNTFSRDTVSSNSFGTLSRVNFTGGIFIFNFLPAANAIYKNELGAVLAVASPINTAMPTVGNAQLVAGSTTLPGYLELLDAAGARAGFAGSSSSVNHLTLGKGGTFTGWVVDGDLVVNNGASITGGVTLPTGNLSVNGGTIGASGNINAGARLRASLGAFGSGDPAAAALLVDFVNNPAGTTHVVRLPNGVIFQSGDTVPPTGNVDGVTFGTAFPTACRFVSLTITGDIGNQFPVSYSIVTQTTSGFTVRVLRWNGAAFTTTGGIGFRYFAVGY